MPVPTIPLIGNVVADPELRYTNSGKAVANLRVACNSRYKNDAGEWVDGDSTFLDVICWNNAEAIADKVHKGSRVIVIGQLKQRSYEKDGQKRSVYEVTADEVALVVYAPRAGNTSSPAPATAPADDPWAGAVTTEDTPF